MENYEDLPIGIDLGTTYSCIGVYRNAAVEIIPNEKGDRTTPSIVSFLDDDIYVGEQTEYKRLKNPKNKIYAVKRIIGRDYEHKEVLEDINNFSYKVINNNGRPQIEVNSNGIKKYSPEEISAKVLAKLKKSAEAFLQKDIKKVVITVPAYFTERQKQATKNAGEIAGLDVIKIINEPTAAALAYGFGKCQNNNGSNLLGKKIIFDEIPASTFRSNFTDNVNHKETQNILVFDLGGGTLDVTLLELEEGDITVKAHSGKMHLGGEDFDNILVQYCIEKFKIKTSIDLNDEKYLKQKLRLKEHCEKAKRELSYRTDILIEIESLIKGKDLDFKLTRAKFEDLCKEKFDLCKEPILEVLEKSNTEKNDIDEIVLVGGSTRIPKIQSMLKEFFDGKELNRKLNPDEAVAYGATIEAALQMGKYEEDVVLLDVCPFSLGIAVVNREDKKNEDISLMSEVIKKGTKLPCKKTKNFYPSEDYQHHILFRVFEGENKYIKNNYLLGKFYLDNLPLKKAKEITIEVTFELDEDSILTVTAIEKDNKSNSNSIVIKNDKGGLSKNEIEKAKENQENETFGKDLEPAMIIESNYKKEINELFNKVNSLTDQLEQFQTLIQLQKCIENFISTFNKDNEDNFTYKQKMHYFLTYLFHTYSSILNFKSYLSEEEKEDIISKVNNYLELYEKKGINFATSLVKIFNDNENEIFGEFCIQLLSFYSQRATEFYSNNEKKNSKHFLEEALSIIEKYSIKKRVENDSELLDRFNSILSNCDELLNIIKAESIEKYCKSFSKDILIKEEDYQTDEEKLDILDRFKDALLFLKNPQKRADKLLKAIYLANIVKIEFKMFNSNNYDTLIKMIEDCINLKLSVPEGCISPNLDWFNEICNIKTEIEQKQLIQKENPKEVEKKIKEKLNDVLSELDSKFKQGKISFFYYILTEHPPNGIDNDFIFSNPKDLENSYNSNKKKFMKKLRRLYNPMRYKGNKEEEQKLHSIMQEISMKLNIFE